MIFVLEDDPERIEWFKEHWPDVLHTDNPLAGLDLIRDHPELEMIFLDHDLGGGAYLRGEHGDGIDFAKAMAAEKLHEDTPVFIHSLNAVGAENIENALSGTHSNVRRVPFYILINEMRQNDG